MTAKISLETLPLRMRDLPLDERGYPVPWFVDWIDGKPEFRAMDPEKLRRAIQRRLCWVCGRRLGVFQCFVAGPMCGINRTSSEPPSHADCAKWSALNCPFLSNPRMVRREDEVSDSMKGNVAGFGLMRNPGVVMVWFTRQYDVFPDHGGRPLIQMGEPDRVEWYCEGRAATRAEVDASIDSGLPALETLARQEKGGMEFLQKSIDRFQQFLPVAP
jgi:hypothetical protein